MDTSGMEGTVLFYGEDLRKNFNRLSLLIGSVPQENIFYQDSTVEEELTRAAQLRLPVRDVRKRVDEVIRQLKLEKKKKEVIRVCSGGEKKRVNVGIDLVADKKLFCLDEPEAGLDPGSKKEFFEVLHSLAHEGEKNKRKSNPDSDSNRELFEVWRSLAHDYGKSILTIIHDVSDIDMFDQVIIMAKVDEVGRLAFSGSPEEARKAFGGDVRNAYALIEKNPWKYIK